MKMGLLNINLIKNKMMRKMSRTRDRNYKQLRE